MGQVGEVQLDGGSRSLRRVTLPRPGSGVRLAALKSYVWRLPVCGEKGISESSRETLQMSQVLTIESNLSMVPPLYLWLVLKHIGIGLRDGFISYRCRPFSRDSETGHRIANIWTWWRHILITVYRVLVRSPMCPQRLHCKLAIASLRDLGGRLV